MTEGLSDTAADGTAEAAPAVEAERRGFFRRLHRELRFDAALDLGAATARAYVSGSGSFLSESSCVVLDGRKDDGEEVVAVGSAAHGLRGRTSRNFVYVAPFDQGIVREPTEAITLIKQLLKQLPRPRLSIPGKLLVTIPPELTSIDLHALNYALEPTWSGVVYTIPAAVAAALGAGVPISTVRCALILDIGASCTAASVVSQQGIIASRRAPIGGQTFDAAIAGSLRRNHRLLVGPRTAELLKKSIGGALVSEKCTEVRVSGQSLSTGSPEEIFVTQNEVVEAFAEPLQEIAHLIREVVDRTPPEMSADLVDLGVYVVGGGGLLPDIDLYLADRVGLPVTLIEEPLDASIAGSAEVLARWDELSHLVRRL